MKKITDIESQTRPGSRRVNIYLDGQFAFSLAEDLAARLVPGSFLSEEEVAELRRDDDLHRIYDAALTLLSYRPRSVAELKSRLLRKREFDPVLVEEALEKLERQSLVNDRDFAQFWVENRQTHQPRGGRLLGAELRFKGIDKEIIDDVLPDGEQEEDAAYRVAIRKARSLESLEWQEFRRRLGDHLVRRGFGYEVAGSAVRKVWNELHGETGEDE